MTENYLPDQSPIAPDGEAILPEFLRPIFWEVEFERLRIQKQQRYIIERILEYGDDPAIGWLRTTFDPETISEVVRRSRKISRNTATLWALLLDIPKDEVLCLSKPYPMTPNIF